MYKMCYRPGLKNIGNTCYMNSIFQCLSTLDYEDNNNDSNFIKEFVSLMKSLKYNYNESITYLNPEIVRHYLPCSKFKECNQQDSHEFLLFILSILQREKIFINEGIMSYTTRYVGCNHIDIENQNNFVISLPVNIPHNNNTLHIYECIEWFIKEELLDDKANCNKCKKNRQCSLQISFTLYPRVLIFHLKKFCFYYHVKINKDIKFPFINFKLPENDKKKYDLYAICSHIGTLDSGHYISCIKDGNNWFYCNDSHVKLLTTIDELNFITENAYLLFYKMQVT